MPKLPGVHHARAVNALERLGFAVKRQGKHIVMTNGREVLVIPRADPINPYTMAAIVKSAGLTIDDFKKLL